MGDWNNRIWYFLNTQIIAVSFKFTISSLSRAYIWLCLESTPIGLSVTSCWHHSYQLMQSLDTFGHMKSENRGTTSKTDAVWRYYVYHVQSYNYEYTHLPANRWYFFSERHMRQCILCAMSDKNSLHFKLDLDPPQSIQEIDRNVEILFVIFSCIWHCRYGLIYSHV